MTITSRYDPSNPNHKATCTRTKCAEMERPAHPAGLHLDQRWEFYDGPDSQLGALSIYVRDSARRIVRDAPALMPEVMDLVTYIEFLQDQATACRADKDRSVLEASARSGDCEHHGEEIKALGDQVHAFSQSERRNDAGRLALLGLLFELDKVTKAYRDGRLLAITVSQLVSALEDASKKAHAAHDRAWKS